MVWFVKTINVVGHAGTGIVDNWGKRMEDVHY